MTGIIRKEPDNDMKTIILTALVSWIHSLNEVFNSWSHLQKHTVALKTYKKKEINSKREKSNRLKFFSLEKTRLRRGIKSWVEERRWLESNCLLFLSKWEDKHPRQIENWKKKNPKHFTQCILNLHWARTSSCTLQMPKAYVDLKKKKIEPIFGIKIYWELLKIRHHFWFRKC